MYAEQTLGAGPSFTIFFLYFLVYGFSIVQAAIAESIVFWRLFKLNIESLLWLIISMNLVTAIIGSIMPWIILFLIVALFPEQFLDLNDYLLLLLFLILCVAINTFVKTIIAKVYLKSINYKVSTIKLTVPLMLITVLSIMVSLCEVYLWYPALFCSSI
jgi:hypothetical protein